MRLIILAVVVTVMAAMSMGYWLARVVDEIRDRRQYLRALAEMAADGRKAARERPAETLSGPPAPDIDVAEPFGDPPDDDGPDDDMEPSQAEVSWANENIIPDTLDHRFWLPENQHALSILRRARGAAPDPRLLPVIARTAADLDARRDFDDLIAALPTSR
jgi:hypothetical protein